MRKKTSQNTAVNRITTVKGEIPSPDIGLTLMHEHLIHRIDKHSGNRDNRCEDIEVIIEETSGFRQSGGTAICDVTPLGLGRNPKALKVISERTGLSIISAVGLYHRETWPNSYRNLTPEALCESLVRETAGDSSGIPAGLLGEFSTHSEPGCWNYEKYKLLEHEAATLQGVAMTQQRTGLSVYLHAGLGRPGMAQLKVLDKAGAHIDRVIVGHCDIQTNGDDEIDIAYYHELLRQGAVLGFDLFSWSELMSDQRRIQYVTELINEGFTRQLLFSTDTCRLSHLHTYGGRGFDYLLTTIVPALKEKGISEKDIQTILIENPRRLLSH